MKIRISILRKIIREEIERNLRWSAGFFGGVGSRSRKGNIVPPPGLGSEQEENIEEKNYEEKERFSQVGAKFSRGKRKRHGNAWRH